MKRWAIRPEECRGRVHEDAFVNRTDPFEVDRHRVLQSAAFRRLEYKTQVFVTHEGDHFRTRLTHTLEVAAIARQLAQALDANVTLAEVIALAHDLGHAPFGHAGEAMLNELMADAGGFEHNLQSLRVIDYLEHPFPPFRGLNLSFETREGLVKHSTKFDTPSLDALPEDVRRQFDSTGPFPSVEGQIANMADRLAYDCHDLEDALGAGLIDEDALNEMPLWARSAEGIRGEFATSPTLAIRRPILDRLAGSLVDDVVAETRRRLAEVRAVSADDVRRAGGPVVALSESVEAKLGQMEMFLFEHVYRHHRILRMDHKAGMFIRRLFEQYCEKAELLPHRFAQRIEAQGIQRVVCDYISGMTDRYCELEFRRLFESGAA